jgi:hypothetical protein
LTTYDLTMLRLVAGRKAPTRGEILGHFGHRRSLARTEPTRGVDVLTGLIRRGYLRERMVVGRSAKLLTLTPEGREAVRNARGKT